MSDRNSKCYTKLNFLETYSIMCLRKLVFPLQDFTARVIISVFPWQKFIHISLKERHSQRRVQQLLAHLHIVTTFCGNGFKHFDGSSVAKCSSHPLFPRLLSCLAFVGVARSQHALYTRKAPLDVGFGHRGRERINSNTSSGLVFFPELFESSAVVVDLYPA